MCRVDKLRRHLGMLHAKKEVVAVSIVIVGILINATISKAPSISDNFNIVVWLLRAFEVLQTVLGIAWLVGLLWCVVDVLQSKVLPFLRSFHDVLRDEKY